ncbi:hypothetical protein [Mesorhizobium sp. WSM4313]|uniref:hypothetical protein n=1 Tax=Mesorhizobium sp. WSM4313 TaxID=2029412 RepID=UPI001FD952AF|nr:hypothetical protein [Mesorhizobium sp. WSM4313]
MFDFNELLDAKAEAPRRRDRQSRPCHAHCHWRGTDDTPDDGKSAAAKELGSKSGKKRAANMTPERRAEIAKKAAESRWRK